MENNKRQCEVNGVIGYFHCWEKFSELQMDETVGYYLCSGVRAIVEFHDGVKQVPPQEVRFMDEDSLSLLNKNINMLENKLDVMENELIEELVGLSDLLSILFAK